MTVSRRTIERQVRHETRYVPADGSVPTDPRLGYLIAGFTDEGAVAQPGEAFTTAMWSRDLSGRCSGGKHWNCNHSIGGSREHGVQVTGADGQPHTWRCGCDCHTAPDPQVYAPKGDKWLVAAHKERQHAARPIVTVELPDDRPVQLELFGAVA